MSVDFNKTLNLPVTDFQMRAGLAQKEPSILERLEKNKIYERLMSRNEGKPLYILHDGPPYANGDIHLGTALNKVLKDIIVRYKNMSGYKAPFVPGWDTHGLPIELKAAKKVGSKRADMSVIEFRQHCKQFALDYLDIQKAQFKRLGVIGEFDNPYLTLKPEFEAKQVEIFGEMYEKGLIYKGLKPVYWCSDCSTALAEAEVEYEDEDCDSIYVKFRIKDDLGRLSSKGIDPSKTFFVIWTTTTWTLPGNVAICLGRDFEYSVVSCSGENYILASELVEDTMKAAGAEEYSIAARFMGSELELMKAEHPFLERDSLIILGDHVTLEAGTGCVHTAPGHGIEDFIVCQNYKELPTIVPVDSEGRLTGLAGKYAGLTTDESCSAIVEDLKAAGHLLALERINHQYPHCWRCRKPILFRATEQWFCSVEGIKSQAIEAIKEVKWIPGWGEERITAMVKDRSDWCISRQRVWGVPIPIFYCKQCKSLLCNKETIADVVSLFKREGSDGWYTHSAEEILSSKHVCSCGCSEYTKESDIMDVWFDSGVSHAAVLTQRDNLSWPSDLYLEGNDQYRGWFQSSLLTSVAWRGKAPYKAVCTHGWVVDGEGRKMSKSLGNGIDPSDIVNEYGADILRLWVASSDYHADIRISKDILKQLSEGYRKIRNTARFILGCLNDFDPAKDSVDIDNLFEIDKFALSRLDELTARVRKAYDSLEFHQVYHAVHNFCVVDMSSFYLDVLKDRLYVENAGSVSRRAAQTAIYIILDTITRLISPILAFTAEEIYSFLPKRADEAEQTPLFAGILESGRYICSEAVREKWERILLIREDVKKALELARADKVIGSSLEAKLVLYTDDSELKEFIEENKDDMAAAYIVSQIEIAKGSGEYKGEYVKELSVTVAAADGEKCERCWLYRESVGNQTDYPTLCSRCRDVIVGMQI